MCCCKSRTRNYVLISFGIVFLALGLGLALSWTLIFDALLRWQLALSPDSMSFKMWKQPPIPIYLDIYMFNMTNADEFLKKGWSVKPKLEEVGPYVYLEEHDRVNLIWNENGTVTYNQTRTWHYKPELSKGNLDDQITTLNPIVATMASLVRHKHPVIKLAVDWLIKYQKEDILFTHSVKDQLFDGVDNELLTLIQGLAAPGVVIPFDKFGWFYTRNKSAEFDGAFEIFTGKKGLEDMGKIANWNYKSSTGLYPSPCDQVNGSSAGELWWPLGDPPPETLSIFTPDICSSIPIVYEGPTEKYGIHAARYTVDDKSLDNGTYNQDQRCYANENSPEWLPHGLRNASACRWGAPAYFSMPHLLLADESLLEHLEPGSQNPDPEKHKIILDFEPNTGLPMKAKANGQLNLQIQQVERLDFFKDAPTFYWPVIWFTQRAELSEDLASMLKGLLIVRNGDKYFMWPLFGLGALLTIVGVSLAIVQRRKMETEEEEEGQVNLEGARIFVINNNNNDGPTSN